MDGNVSSEQLVRLWNHYVQVSQRYAAAKQATNAAEAAVSAAQDRCQVAYDEEVQWARAVASASQAFSAAADAAFLVQHGIYPDGLIIRDS